MSQRVDNQLKRKNTLVDIVRDLIWDLSGILIESLCFVYIPCVFKTSGVIRNQILFLRNNRTVGSFEPGVSVIRPRIFQTKTSTSIQSHRSIYLKLTNQTAVFLQRDPNQPIRDMATTTPQNKITTNSPDVTTNHPEVPTVSWVSEILSSALTEAATTLSTMMTQSASFNPVQVQLFYQETGVQFVFINLKHCLRLKLKTYLITDKHNLIWTLEQLKVCPPNG